MDEFLIFLIVALLAAAVILILWEATDSDESNYYKINVCKYLGGKWHESQDGPLGTGLCIRDGEVVEIRKRSGNG